MEKEFKWVSLRVLAAHAVEFDENRVPERVAATPEASSAPSGQDGQQTTVPGLRPRGAGFTRGYIPTPLRGDKRSQESQAPDGASGATAVRAMPHSGSRARRVRFARIINP